MQMPLRHRSFLAHGVLLLVLFAQACTAWALDTTQITRYLEQVRSEAEVPGMSAAIMVKGQLVYSGGVGQSDVESGMLQNGLSVHNIGSISKTQAVVAVMQLVEQGKVDLDADIQTYVPWFPKKQAPITTRQILTHTSGIRHYRQGEFGEGDVLSFRQFDKVEESTRRWRDEPLLFTPGEYWSYSTFATNLLQALVENVSGEGFEAYLKRHVWEPAGMVDTQFDVPTRVVLRRGRGYGKEWGTLKLVNAVQENVSYKYAGGGMISTDEDLVRFGHALNTGVLLKPETMKEMYRPQLRAGIQYPPADLEKHRKEKPNEPLPQPPVQALVWRIDTDASGRRFPQHSGSVKGTLSQLYNFTDEDVVVAVHVNCYSFRSKDLATVAGRLAEFVLPGTAATGKTK